MQGNSFDRNFSRILLAVIILIAAYAARSQQSEPIAADPNSSIPDASILALNSSDNTSIQPPELNASDPSLAPNASSQNATDEYLASLRDAYPEYTIGYSGAVITISRGLSSIEIAGADIMNISDISVISSPDMPTDIAAVNSIPMDNAVITLARKEGASITGILVCGDFDFSSGACAGSWQDSGLPYTADPAIIRFETSHFSAYAGQVANDTPANLSAGLDAWSDTQAGAPFGGRTIYPGNVTYVYANYSNASASLIQGACCRAVYSGNASPMDIDHAKGLYSIGLSFAHAGQYSYSIDCACEPYESRSAQVSVLVSNYTVSPVNDTNQSQQDLDHDGFASPIDCNDANPDINPGRAEVLYNNADDDCNPATPDYLALDIIPDRQNYNPGNMANILVSATAGSDTYITINTPTNISYVYIFSGNAYPAIQQFGFTNRSGHYTIDAVTYFGNYTLQKASAFDVANNLQITTESEKTGYSGEGMQFTAAAAGGAGSLTYEWNLGNNVIMAGQTITYNYTAAGTYNAVLTVRDPAGNLAVNPVAVHILPRYVLLVYVSGNQSALEDARVRLDGDSVYTNISGYARFLTSNGTYEFRVSRDGYQGYSGDIKINGSQTVSVTLEPAYEELPLIVSIISPSNGSSMKGAIPFRFTTNYLSNCTLYTSDGSGWWTDSGGIESASPAGENEIVLSNLDDGAYTWRIECIRGGGDSYITSPRSLYANLADPQAADAAGQANAQGNPTATTGDPAQEDPNFSEIQDVYNILPDFTQYDPDQRKVVEILKLEDLVADTKKKLERANQDMFNLRYRMDVTNILQARNDILAQIAELKNTTPISLTIEDKVNFVKYADEKEIENDLRQYYGLKKDSLPKVGEGRFIEDGKAFQKKVSVSTSAYIAVIKYYSGREDVVTVVSKEIQISTDSDKIAIAEFIPKEVAESSSLISVIGRDARVLLDDPVLEIENNRSGSLEYYIKGRVDLEKIPKIVTIAIQETGADDPAAKASNSVTGMVFMDSLGVSQGKQKIFLAEIGIIAFLLVAYVLMNMKFAGIGHQPRSDSSSLESVRKAIREGRELITKNNIDDAALKYEEAKLVFDTLQQEEKDTVYEEISEYCHEVNIGYISNLIEKALGQLAQGDFEHAGATYEEIDCEYKKLPEDLKQKIYPRCCELASLIAGRAQCA